jgi:glycosyltransferase involved in cell wall biosynthesis
MRVVHLNNNDIYGGTGRAASRLHKGLLRMGHASSMLVSLRGGNDPAVRAFKPPGDVAFRVRRFVRRRTIKMAFDQYRHSRPAGLELFTDDRNACGGAIVEQLPPADIVNLHWVSGLVDYKSFFPRVVQHRPVVWTLHDMNPFTGGCHYDQGCGRYTDRCGACPQLGSSAPDDLSRQIWRRKREVFCKIGRDQLHFVTPSQWLAREAKRSSLLSGFPVTVIPNGLDTADFAPCDQGAARKALGLAPGARVLLFVAQNVHNQRKGFPLLLEAIKGMASIKDCWVLSIGSGGPEINGPVEHIHLGNIASDRLLSLVYSAASCLLNTSLQDNLPNTIMEAMACGTPAVGFEVGGVPDLIRHGQTGLLAPRGDIDAFRNSIVSLLSDAKRLEDMSVNCRRIAEEEYDLDIQARRYASLYKKMVEG